METAIQLLIKDFKESGIIRDQHYLGIERNQIINAYYAGTAQFDNAAPIVHPKTPTDYYSETYGKETAT